MLATAFETPPLVVPELVFSKQLFTVKIRLDEPLISSKDLRELITLCAIADTCIERVHKLPKAAQTFDADLLRQIEDQCKQIAPGEPAQEVLQELGLLDTYPYLRQSLIGDKIETATQHPGASYLNYISLLNQVVMMGTQLYHDACIPQHHKYCAHQIALLYQCLNMLQGDTKPIRRLIEARFDEIKVITESKSPLLDMELSDWLQEVTWLCREEIKNCPSYVHRKLQQVIGIVHTRWY